MPRRPSAPAATPDTDDPSPPGAFPMFLEGRAPMEYFSMLAAYPGLRLLPRGDGRPVMVVGMGMNTLALYAIADRLAQPIGAWKPFVPSGTWRWLVPVGRDETAA